jgi:RNA polymerase sigma-70 factor, ECF subfamily
MTTAPDLPMAVPSVAVPAQTEDARPQLALVQQAPAPDTEIVDFDEALRAATPRLVRYATRRLGDPHEAEEVVQEALLRAFQHRAVLATEDDLMAWLTVVTGRLVIDRLRVRGRTTPVAELPAGARTSRDTADVVVARDEARLALDALEAMPSRQASVLWAREVEGLRYDEIGVRYGLSEPTVRSLLHRARRTLRREYSMRGGTFPAVGLVALAPWMRGLHVAGRVRDLARKGTAVTATAATGLALVTVAPLLWSHPVPAHTHAAPAAPAVTEKSSRLRLTAAKAPVAKTAPAATAPSITTTTADTDSSNGMHRVRLVPRACTKSGVGTNCSAPTSSMLYLVLPTHREVGIETNYLPAGCTVLPTTPLTHCQPSNRKN